MKKILILALITMLAGLTTMAQTLPTATPTATITAPADLAGELGSDEYEAPLSVLFEANAETEGWDVRYEWRICRQGEKTPILVRYDANLDYTFLQHGMWEVDLLVTFTLNGDTVVYDREDEKDSDTPHITRMGPLLDSPYTISIGDSQLEFPNAFSPNGDGINDYLNAKQANSRGLVEFEAAIFNRWGKKIYSWTDWKNRESGWDGTDHGRQCPDGAYYLIVKARGADGRKYHIKKTISVLTGFRENDMN